ncbi:MAG: bile acid:sodium symporter [Planctomycetaceae bacterium]
MPHLLRHWFVYSLLIVIPGGMAAGRVPWIHQFVGTAVNTQVYVFAVLFCMAITLPLAHLKQTATRPLSVLLTLGVNAILLPLLAWGLFLLHPTSPFAAGLLIVAVVPSTMASAAVWTRRSGGNDALCLIVTLITNGGCFLIIPFWLWLTLGTSVPINAPELMKKLLLIALLPMGLGQFLRSFRPVRALADRNRMRIGVLAQAGILIIVTVGSIRTGPVLAESSAGLSFVALLMVLGQCLLLHAIGLACGWWGIRWMRGRPEDAIGAMFSEAKNTPHCSRPGHLAHSAGGRPVPLGHSAAVDVPCHAIDCGLVSDRAGSYSPGP